MESKVCRTCNLDKSLDQYSIWSGRKSHRPDCKSCVNEKQKRYLKSNPETYNKVKKVQLQKYWVKRNEELPLLKEKIGKIKICTTCGFEGDISNFKDASVKNSLSKVRLRGTCKTCENARENEWIKNNPDKVKIYHKKTYNRRKKDVVFTEKKKQQQKLYHQRPEVKKRHNEKSRLVHKSPKGIWRRLLSNALTQLKTTRPKQTRTLSLLGFTHEDLFIKVGNKPSGDYHLDHIIPLSWMVNNTPPSIACHLDNLSWITGDENKSKGNRFANSVSLDYFNKVIQYIKPEYKIRFVVSGDYVHDNKKSFILEQWAKGESSIV
jgi:hypothetical protein